MADKRAFLELTDDEKEVAERLTERRSRIVSEWAGTDHPIHRYVETQLSVDCDGFTISGRPDVYFIQGDSALVVDEKSLAWGDHEPSASNLQLRTYACLVHSQHPDVQNVTVALNQDGHAIQTCKYWIEDLIRAHWEIREYCRKALVPDAKLQPGEKQCRWCRARVICPALNADREALEVADVLGPVETQAMVGGFPGDVLANMLVMCKPVEFHIEALRDEARRRLEADPDSVPGWMLKPGAAKRIVSDLGTVTARLEAIGCGWPEITAACSIPLKNVESLVRGATGEKGRGLKSATDAILDGCTESKETAPSLVRTSKEIEG
jgi:hypothetical protein